MVRGEVIGRDAVGRFAMGLTVLTATQFVKFTSGKNSDNFCDRATAEV